MAVSLPRQNYDLMSRESNGRAPFDYDAMVPVKGDTLKRSLAMDRMSDEGLEMNCKDKNESDNEPDGEPAAKLRRGGGRRKQSKPMRMFAELDAPPDSDPSQAQASNRVTRDSRVFDEGKGTAGFLTLPGPNSFVCELCHEYFQTDDALKEHIDEIHAMDLDEENVKDTLCPTKYHLLGKELTQESDFELVVKEEVKEMKSVFSEKKVMMNASAASDEEDSYGSCDDWTSAKKDEEETSPGPEPSKMCDKNPPAVAKSPVEQLPTRLFPIVDESHPGPGISHGPQLELPQEGNNIKKATDFGASMHAYEAGAQSEQHPQAPMTSWDPTKSRIFHPDAYCEICDREFCNKYFLKTHKANKHGIYDNNTPGMEMSTSVNNDLFFNMLSQQQQQQQQPLNTTPPKTSPPRHGGDPIGSVTGLPSMLSTACGSVENPGSMTLMKSSSSDSDECCEICHKHFLSRGQLKRHKQEIHGFPQGSEGSKRSNIGGLSVSSPSSIPMSASMENPSASHPLLLPHIPATSGSMPNALSDYGRMANLSNLMFLNPFNSPLAVIPPLFPTSGLGFRPNALSLPQLPLQDVQKGTSNSRFPGDTSAVPSSLLQSMGVLNAEALMELYRKEFCNNYLMRSQETSSRAGLFSGGMTGFPSAMPTSLTSGMPFPLPGSMGNQDSVKVKFEVSAENTEVCEVCKKTFVNKQSLVSHLLTHHSKQDSCDLASELMKLDKLNEDHHFEKTMFSNMVAAKLVDRVQCDICSKEVCNKYFLKTHKIKVHGWDPVSGEREMLEKPVMKQPSPLHSQNPVPEPLVPDLMNVEKPKEDELLQMGIDPEAYCEICKKEFCNKYFLKTHKQNIHGIKTAANPMDNRTIPAETWSFPPAPSSQSNPLTATQLSLLAGVQQMQSLTPVLNPPPSLMSMLDAGGPDGSAERRSWKWKEPVNAMRVTCEICNKVLCNKYFLKTHMMKRHGVNYDTITGQVMTAGKSQTLSDYASFRDARDDTLGSDDLSSSQPSIHSATEKQHSLNIQAVIRHVDLPEERPSSGEVTGRNDDESSVTSGRQTDRRDRDRSGNNEIEQHTPSAVGSVLSEMSKALDLTSAATTVMAKTWHVPSDGRCDQDDQMTDNESRSGNVNFTPGAEANLHRISAEDDDVMYAEREASGSAHAMREAAFDETHGSSGASSPLSSSFEENKSQGCVQNFVGLGKFDGGATATETAKAAIANHIRSQQKKKLFRCTHCRDRFQLRSQCELHIRTCHPRLEGLSHHGDYGSERTGNKQSTSSNESSSSANSLGYLNGYANTKLPNFSSVSTERKDAAVPGLNIISKQPVSYAQPIDPANLSNILMQPFLLKEVGGENHFAASLVYLPALQKINEPVSVTFSLTPILQH